jgi:hypothetical protein
MQNVATWSMAAVCALVSVSVFGCSSPNGVGATTVELGSELPACNSAHRGAVYFVKSSNELRYCDGRSYQLLGPAADTALLEVTRLAGASLDCVPLTAADIARTAPLFVRYALDLGAAGIQPETLSESARSTLTGPEAEHVRDAYATDVLAACAGATLVGLGDELDYLDDAGAQVELALRIQSRSAAASVVPSMLPFDGPQATYADILLRTRLEHARAAEANVSSAWDKTLIVIFTDNQTADLLEDAYAALPRSVRGDSIVIVVESLGETVGLFHQSV